MRENLPTYYISIDPELSANGEHLGFTQIAYTAKPSIMARGVAFKTNEAKVFKRKFQDALKLRLAAPILIPDLNIYRNDDVELGEHNVVFTKDVIEQLVKDFFKQAYKTQFNLDHTNQTTDSHILESWFVEDPKTDKSVTVYGLDPLPVGSYFVVSQFYDEKYFKEEIIDKDRLGYSIEGFLAMAFQKYSAQLKKQKMNDTHKQEVLASAPADEKVLEASKEVTNETEMNKDTKLDDVKEPEKKDEAMADAPADSATPPTEGEKPAEPAKEEVDAAAIMAVVQPSIDAIAKELAEIRNMIQANGAKEEPADEMEKEQKLDAAQDAFNSVLAFMQRSKN